MRGHERRQHPRRDNSDKPHRENVAEKSGHRQKGDIRGGLSAFRQKNIPRRLVLGDIHKRRNPEEIGQQKPDEKSDGRPGVDPLDGAGVFGRARADHRRLPDGTTDQAEEEHPHDVRNAKPLAVEWIETRLPL